VSNPSSPCECEGAQEPRAVTNPPGLSTISDRVGDFGDFRAALLRPLPGEQALGGWAPAAGDLGLQVLEWWAYLADVLTFYNEQTANESYLRTAKSAARLADLVALIGYVPTPGVAAVGQLAALRSAGHPDEPLTLPASMPVSSTATPGVPSQVFEVQGAASFEGPSELPVTLAPANTLTLNGSKEGPASVLLSGRVSGVQAGDRLLLVEQGWNGAAEDADESWSWVVVASVASAIDPGTGAHNTLVSFTSAARFGAKLAPSENLSKLIDVHAGDIEIKLPETSLLRSDAGGEIATSRDLAASPAAGEGKPAPRLSKERELSTSADAPRASSALESAVGADEATRIGTVDVSGLGEATRVGVVDVTGLKGIYWPPREPPKIASIPVRQAPRYQLLRPTQTTSLWNHAKSEKKSSEVIASTAPPAVTVHLGASVRAIVPGQLVLFDNGASQVPALALVSSVSESLWTVPYPPPLPESTPPDIVIAHTELGLTTQDAGVLSGYKDLATVALRYGFKEVGTIIGTPAPSLPGLPEQVGIPPGWVVSKGGTTAILQDATGAGVLVHVTSAGEGQVMLAPSGPTPSTLSPPLPVPLRLLLDLVPVSRGSTVASETLGSGNAAFANQSFTLRRSPLTYLSDGSGVSSTLVIYVDDIAWSEVASFYGQSAEAQVYTVSLATDGTATVTFGDGVNGARLNSGAGNVIATYRYGSGVASPPAGRLTTIAKPQPNLASLANPIAVFGGEDPQPIDEVRQNAPASVFTFGRAISGLDYEVIAGQAAGVNRASALWSFDGSTERTAVTIYVGGDAGALAAAQAALAGAEDPNRPVTVLAATAVEVELSCTLVVAANRRLEAVQAAAIAAIADPVSGLFSPASLGIGERLYRSRVDAALMVDGVLAVHELVVSTGREELEDVLDPGPGAYLALGAGELSIAVVSGGTSTTPKEAA
jgi:hypothetical protein